MGHLHYTVRTNDSESGGRCAAAVLVTDGAGVQSLVFLGHVLEPQETVLVPQTSERPVVGEGLPVVTPFHAGLGMGPGDLASEPDRAGHDDRLVCQMCDHLRRLQCSGCIIMKHRIIAIPLLTRGALIKM